MTGHDNATTINALVLIDFQRGFEHPQWGARNNPMAEDNARRLIAAFRATGLPLFHVRHLSWDPGSPLVGRGAEFKEGFTPCLGEPVIEKTVNSAFIGTDLEVRLLELGVGRLTICGLTTPHCVSTTTRMAANLGFRVTLVHDASAAFSSNADTSFDTSPGFTAEETHRAALAQLNGEFAAIVSTDAAIAVLPRHGVTSESDNTLRCDLDKATAPLDARPPAAAYPK